MSTKTTLPILALIAAVVLAGCLGPSPSTPDSDTTNAAGNRVLTFTGTLEEGDMVMENDNSFYDNYFIEAESGDNLVITMTSTEFDTYLILLYPGADSQQLDNDDATGLGTNSQITHTTTEAGLFRIGANSFSGGATGAYTLTVEYANNTAAPAGGDDAGGENAGGE